MNTNSNRGSVAAAAFASNQNRGSAGNLARGSGLRKVSAVEKFGKKRSA